jgi:hypothetical protein
MYFKMLWRALPLVNLTIGSTALWIQGRLLLPWHDELDASFQSLKKQRDAEQKMAFARLRTIEAKMSDLDKTFINLRDQRSKENAHVLDVLCEIKQEVTDQ